MADKKLNIKVSTTGAGKAKQEIGGLNGAISKMGKAVGIASAAYFGARGLISGFSTVIRLAGEQEQAEKKLEVALGKTSTALLNHASALQKMTAFGDEAIIGVQASLAAFIKDEEQIKKATEATLDMAVAMGMDLKAAGDLVATTLGSSTNAMRRYGIQVEGAVGSTERLESLTNNVATLFGGQASAQAETMAGALSQAGNSAGDLAEAIGERLSPLTKVLAENFTDVVEQLTALVTQKDIEFIGPIFSEADSALLDFRESLKEMSLEQLIFEMESANGLLKNMSSEADAFDLLTAKSNAASYEVAALTQNIKKSDEAEIQFGTTLEKVNTAHIVYLINANKLKREQLQQDLRSAALTGQSAMESMKSVVQAEAMKHVAKLITSILSNPAIVYPFNLVLAAGAGGVAAGLMDKALGAIPNQFATGADFITSGATPMLVGESGPERVSVTPLTPGMNQNGPQGGITLNISGGLIDDSYVRNELIPALNKATSMGSGLA